MKIHYVTNQINWKKMSNPSKEFFSLKNSVKVFMYSFKILWVSQKRTQMSRIFSLEFWVHGLNTFWQWKSKKGDLTRRRYSLHSGLWSKNACESQFLLSFDEDWIYGMQRNQSKHKNTTHQEKERDWLLVELFPAWWK